MDETHPALEVARSSWRCVQAHDREGWLALMADDVCIEDPIGVGPTNPTGKGVSGKDEVAAFYDRHIAPAKIEIESHESHVAGKESAHVMTLTTTFPNGARARVRGIFTYRVNDAGRLASMRGYWTLDAMQFTPPPEAR